MSIVYDDGWKASKIKTNSIIHTSRWIILCCCVSNPNHPSEKLAKQNKDYVTKRCSRALFPGSSNFNLGGKDFGWNFDRKMVVVFASMKTVLSYRGPNFIGSVVKSFQDILKLKRMTVFPVYPHADRMVERRCWFLCRNVASFKLI